MDWCTEPSADGPGRDKLRWAKIFQVNPFDLRTLNINEQLNSLKYSYSSIQSYSIFIASPEWRWTEYSQQKSYWKLSLKMFTRTSAYQGPGRFRYVSPTWMHKLGQHTAIHCPPCWDQDSLLAPVHTPDAPEWSPTAISYLYIYLLLSTHHYLAWAYSIHLNPVPTNSGIEFQFYIYTMVIDSTGKLNKHEGQEDEKMSMKYVQTSKIPFTTLHVKALRSELSPSDLSRLSSRESVTSSSCPSSPMHQNPWGWTQRRCSDSQAMVPHSRGCEIQQFHGCALDIRVVSVASNWHTPASHQRITTEWCWNIFSSKWKFCLSHAKPSGANRMLEREREDIHSAPIKSLMLHQGK